MSSTDRQNRLIAAEDWKKIYQSFKNAEFQSYDFDNLRRTMISYIRENYPEDFNDYIESSEYLALIDVIAFLGQNLAFRFDLNARDNFLELAERRDSVLRWARQLSYKPKRNQTANGLLKFSSVSTTESVIDSNGRNLSNQTIVWNDPTNANWYEQFIKVVNASIPVISQFGNPENAGNVSGVKCEQYRFNGINTEVPLFSFSKSISGKNTTFEVVSTSFEDGGSIYEEAPSAGNNMAFLYRNDGRGASSANTGFFVHFRQGTLQQGQFNVTQPGPNEKVDLDAVNVNDTDVWLYSVDAIGTELDLWTKVDASVGNNVIYNSVSKNQRKIYSVLSRINDRISFMFADGVFGDIPSGRMKAYYRTSNGLSYTINPADITGVVIDVPYVSHAGKQESLRVTLALKSQVVNSSPAESSESIKLNAPATYYTQGRMITGEDYQIIPLSVDQEIIKSHTVNRVSSGISRFYDLKESSGKYSNTTIVGNDGILFKEHNDGSFTFKENSKSAISNIVLNNVQSVIKKSQVKDFFTDEYRKYVRNNQEAFDYNAAFVVATSDTNICTGYFRSLTGGAIKLGNFSTDNKFRLITANSMVRFVKRQTGEYKWVKVVKIIGDGTAGGVGVLPSGNGAVVLNSEVPSGYIVDYVLPKVDTKFESPLQHRMVDLIFAKKQFGLRIDFETARWAIISDVNLNTTGEFSPYPDNTGQNLDTSWIVLFETTGDSYRVTYRGLQYVFESVQEVRFFFDSGKKVFDSNTGKVVVDKINVLGINSKPESDFAIGKDVVWDIVDGAIGSDGYVDNRRLLISFADSDQDGVVDDPDLFDLVVANSQYEFWERKMSSDESVYYDYFDNSNNTIRVRETLDNFIPSNGAYIYVTSTGRLYTYDSGVFTESDKYIAHEGRSNLTFKYQHAASSSDRIDPSPTNIFDVFLLTRGYDNAFRQWITGVTEDKPLPLTSDEMFVNFGEKINRVKSISDEVIYHPVKYKALFGDKADETLQAIFKVTKNPQQTISDNDVKVGVVSAINQFFAVENWNFGDTFYFGELVTFIINKMTPYVVNVVITPKQPTLAFGSLFEIKSNPDEIFISSATVDEVEIISEVSASKLNVLGNVQNSTQPRTGF